MPCSEERLAYSKEYYKKNRDYIIERNSNTYYDKYRDDVRKRMAQRVTCVCGCNVSKGNLLTHTKSKRHQDHLNPPTEPIHTSAVEHVNVPSAVRASSFPLAESWRLSWK